MLELEIEQNLNYEINRLTVKGKSDYPLFGKELTGLINFGNTCYVSSTMQVLNSLLPFKKR
jgi:ubiquitin carboxyl-terminal hydrolase 5/13